MLNDDRVCIALIKRYRGVHNVENPYNMTHLGCAGDVWSVELQNAMN